MFGHCLGVEFPLCGYRWVWSHPYVWSLLRCGVSPMWVSLGMEPHICLVIA